MDGNFLLDRERAGNLNREGSNEFWLASLIGRIVRLVNGVNQYAFIVFLLLLFFFGFRLSPNEEGYLALAKQFYDPNWIQNSAILSEFASTRLIFQYIAGFLLSIFSFEATAGVGRLLLCLLLAWPLAKLYRLFRLDNADIVLHLAFLYFGLQSFFAGEFIFLDFEPKGFAYVFVLFALYYGFAERYRSAALYAVIASYFHLLVGGWFALYFIVYYLIWEKDYKRATGLGLAYMLAMIPLFIFLLPTLKGSISPTDTPVSADWIYCYFKMPFLIGLFASIPYFISAHLEGVLLFIAFFLISALPLRVYRNELNKKVIALNTVIAAGLMLWLIVAYFDREGSFIKYFPFRINALFTFLVFLQLVFLLKHFFSHPRRYPYLQVAVLIWFFIVPAPKNIYRLFIEARLILSSSPNPAYEEMVSFVKNNTEREAVLLLLSQKSLLADNTEFDIRSPEFAFFDMDLPIMRKTERERFVSYLFGPVSPNPEELYRWYVRIQEKAKVTKEPPYLCELRQKHRIDYLLADFEVKDIPCLQLVYQNPQYYLYRIQ